MRRVLVPACRWLLALVAGAALAGAAPSGDEWALQAAFQKMDIRTVQELMGHDSIETTQIYLHVMKKPSLGVKSPFDQLGQWAPPPTK